MGRPSGRKRRKSSDPASTHSGAVEATVLLGQPLFEPMRTDHRPDQGTDDFLLPDISFSPPLDTASTAPTDWVWSDRRVTQTQLPENDTSQGLLMENAGFDETSIPIADPLAAQSNKCQCLSSLYKQLSSFQSLPPTSFPWSLALPSQATSVAWSAVQCQMCPDDFSSGIQNLMLLTTLLTLITNEYAKILDHINQTADQETTVPFRMGDTNPEMMHLHTATPDCPMGINVDLEAEDFRRIAKGVVREKVLGGPHHGGGALVTLLDEMQPVKKLGTMAERDKAHCGVEDMKR